MNIDELKVQKEPMNKGCEYGMALLRQSISKLGLARSVVADKNDVVFIGDKVLETAKRCGIHKVSVVETTGDTLVVVKRTDVDSESVKGKELSLVDNLCNIENIDWDAKNVRRALNTYYGFNPLNWGGDACVVQELKITDLIRPEVERKEEKGEKKFIPTDQLSLFD